jgi:hypothetical protein
MRSHLKILTVATALAASLGGIVAAPASAVLPEFSPGADVSTFSGTGGKSTLATEKKGSMTCTSLTLTGEITGGKSLMSVDWDIPECVLLGLFGGATLADQERKLVLLTFLEVLCYLNKTKKEVGIVTRLSPAHFEVAGKLLVVQGEQVARITPLNTATKVFTITYTPGVNCEGSTRKLEAAENEGSFEPASETGVQTVTFSANQTLVA